MALPLLLPPFLLALGWAMLGEAWPAGLGGTILVFTLWILPLVVFATYAAGAGLSATAIEATRLAGGEARVIRFAARYVFVSALAAAGLGAALSMADPGPGQIFRVSTTASEILTSFAALNDFSLAARQSASVAAVILLAAIPFAWFVAPRLAQALMARQTRRARPYRLHDSAGSLNIALLARAARVIIFGGLWSAVNCGYFLSEVECPGMATKGAIGAEDATGDQGRLTAAGDQADPDFWLLGFAVMRARSFGEHENAVAVFKSSDGFFDGGHIGLSVTVNGDCVKSHEHPCADRVAQ